MSDRNLLKQKQCNCGARDGGWHDPGCPANAPAFGPIVYGSLTARDPADVTKSLWTETGEWVAVDDFNRLKALLEKWQRECTGKHGSQMPCAAAEPELEPATEVMLLVRAHKQLTRYSEIDPMAAEIAAFIAGLPKSNALNSDR